MGYINTFERVEHKYLLAKEDANLLYELIGIHITDDVYPQYSLHNLYLDSPDYTMISKSIEKPMYKEKLRIRSYGDPDDSGFAYIEMKKKYDGIVYKRRIQMRADDVMHCLGCSNLEELHNSGGSSFEELHISSISSKSDMQIGKEIEYMCDLYHPVPKVFIGYDRRAYQGKDENDVRITFDTNIRYRLDHLSLHDDYPDTYLLDDDQCLVEIKVMDRYPIWLTRALSAMELRRTSFSKYGTIYEHILKGE